MNLVTDYEDEADTQTIGDCSTQKKNRKKEFGIDCCWEIVFLRLPLDFVVKGKTGRAKGEGEEREGGERRERERKRGGEGERARESEGERSWEQTSIIIDHSADITWIYFSKGQFFDGCFTFFHLAF